MSAHTPRLAALARRVALASVWAPGALPDKTKSEREALRVIFPVFDLLMIAAGWFGYVFVVPALSEVFSNRLVDGLCVFFSAVAATCLVGVAFPCLWRIELYAKEVLLALLIGFVATLGAIISGATGLHPGPSVDSRWYFVPFVLLAALLVLWRCAWITREPHPAPSREAAA